MASTLLWTYLTHYLIFSALYNTTEQYLAHTHTHSCCFEHCSVLLSYVCLKEECEVRINKPATIVMHILSAESLPNLGRLILYSADVLFGFYLPHSFIDICIQNDQFVFIWNFSLKLQHTSHNEIYGVMNFSTHEHHLCIKDQSKILNLKGRSTRCIPK